MRNRTKQDHELADARRERDQVRREGEEALPRVRRLERRVQENHFAELFDAAFRTRKRSV